MAQFGHNRYGKKGRKIIVYGMITDAQGRPVAVDVYEGNTGDPSSVTGQVEKMPFVYYTPDGVPRIPEPEKWIEYSALFLMFMDKVPEMPKEHAIEEIRPGAEVDWTQY